MDERCCRGDWGETKTEASHGTIAVPRSVIERIHRLKTLTVEVKAGWARRTYPAVKSDGPDDLVFQSVKDGRPMRDNNELARYIKPAARRLNIGWVNWQVLRRSLATWLKMAGADVKDAGAHAGLAGEYDTRCLPAIRAGIAAACSGAIGQFGELIGTNWDQRSV